MEQQTSEQKMYQMSSCSCCKLVTSIGCSVSSCGMYDNIFCDAAVCSHLDIQPHLLGNRLSGTVSTGNETVISFPMYHLPNLSWLVFESLYFGKHTNIYSPLDGRHKHGTHRLGVGGWAYVQKSKRGKRLRDKMINLLSR